MHVYILGHDSSVIFYRKADYLLFFTIICCVAREMNVQIHAVSLMPNHVHITAIFQSRDSAGLFIKKLKRIFDMHYELKHTHPIFRKGYGIAPKLYPKKVISNLAYVYNNPVAGHLSAKASDYRWSFLAYAFSGNPFSEKIPLRNASMPLRRSIKLVDSYRAHNIPMAYNAQRLLFKNLKPREKEFLIDYIITSYNVIDYGVLSKVFGSKDDAVRAFEIMAGDEFDVYEEHEDYAVYRRLSEAVYNLRTGIDFEAMSGPELDKLREQLWYVTGASDKHLRRFLHICN